MTSARFIARRGWPLAIALALFVPSACSPSGPTVVDDSGTYVPNFTFQWDEVNAAGTFIAPLHRFTLIPDQSGKNSGTINNQSTETVGATRNVVTGTFKGRALTLTVTRATGAVSITGKFLTDDTIQMQEPGRSYTVKRNTTL